MSILSIISSNYPVANDVALTSGTYYGPQWLYKNNNTSGTLVPEGSWSLTYNPNSTIGDGTPENFTCWDMSGNPGDRWVSPDLNATGLLTGTNDQTIEMWFYPYSAGMVLLSEHGTPSENSGYHATVFEINDDQTISARLWNGAELTSVATVTLNAWNHVHLQYNGTTQILKLRVNNDPGVTYGGYARNGNQNYFNGGAVYYACGFYETQNLGEFARYYGRLGIVRIQGWAAPSNYWEDAHHYLAAGVTPIQDGNLQAWWNGMTLPDGPNWNDVSGNSHVMTAYGTWNHFSGEGYYEYSAGAYAQSPSGGTHFNTNGTAPEQTITAWVWVSNTTNYCPLFGWENGLTYDHFVAVLGSNNNGSVRQVVRTASGFNLLDGPSYVENNLYDRWVHVALRLTSGQLLTYVNGKHAGSDSIIGNFGSTADYFYLGAASPSIPVALRIADLQFYNRALSEDEIVQNYCFAKNRLGL